MKRLPAAVAIAAVFFAPVVWAQQSDISVKGFGTLGLAHSDNDEADYVSSNRTYVPDGSGRTRQSSFGVDSKLGVQLDWKASSSISATAQVLAKYDYEGKYSPDLEWAFVKFTAAPDLDIRAGRIRPALYLLSDFLDVNYANPWVRPPIEFYSAAPINRMEGVDVLWKPSIGDVSFLIQPYAGTSTNNKGPGGLSVDFKNNLGINLTAQYGDFTYRFGYFTTKLTFSAPVVSQFFGENGTGGALGALCGAGDTAACVQAEALYPADKKGTFASLGIGYDNGEYFVTSEYGKRTTDTYLADGTAAYISGGARIGKLTPYVTYSRWSNDSPTLFAGGATPQTNAVVTGLLVSNLMDQDSVTLGLRYDIASNVALKAQYDRINTDLRNGQAGTGGGLFANRLASFSNRENAVKVMSFSVDVVF